MNGKRKQILQLTVVLAIGMALCALIVLRSCNAGRLAPQEPQTPIRTETTAEPEAQPELTPAPPPSFGGDGNELPVIPFL